MTSLSLAGEWILEDAAGDHACTIALPGDAISALHRAGLIAEPYWGRNEYDLRWIAERDWIISREVTLERTDVDLVLGHVDTLASVLVNGVEVLACQNAHRTYRASLAEVAKVGMNRIELRFVSSVREAARLQEAQPFYIPYQASNNPIPNVNMLRKPQCDYGWDWNIALAPFGVYGEMTIEPSAAPRIEAVRVAQVHQNGAVDLTLTVDLANHSGPVTAAMAGRSASGHAVDGQAVLHLHVDKPDLWWPAGQGAQPLYKLVITAGDVSTCRSIGLRQVALLTDADEAGSRFAFAINGREVFAKGANWIPADALAGRIDRGAVRDLLQSAVDANMNMIRVWGGGRYEPDWFYDLCDELGLMVWQDFMFACNLYPSTPDFLTEVRAEVAEVVRRLQHHASLVLWCGDNELVGALTWFPESRENRDRYLANYDRLNRVLEEGLRAADPGALWWPSSPCAGPLDFGDTWHEDGKGDMHFWSVWHEGRDFEHYRDVRPRFCSEFGFQSYPSMNQIRTFADPADFNIAAPVLESHQKNAGGNARIAETMFRYFRWPERFEDFVYLSQVQQALAIHTAVTYWRSLRPHCMGTLIWQLNDTWPVCSWSSLDYGGDWKLLHHMARRFYAPVLVTAVPDGDDILLRAVNDTGAPVEVSVTVSAVAMDGSLRPLAERSERVGASAGTVARVAQADLGAQEMLWITWDSAAGGGQDIFAPRPFKHYDLVDSGLRMDVTEEDGAYRIELSAKALALFVAVEADVPGRFDDNAFALRPGDGSRVLSFTPREAGARATFVLRDLYRATYA